MEQGEIWAAAYAQRPSPSLEEKLLAQYESLVYQIARRFVGNTHLQGHSENMKDYLVEGRLGLLAAIRKYDPSKNVKFMTLANTEIRGAISHYIRDNQVRYTKLSMPGGVYENWQKMLKAKTKLESRGLPVTEAAVAKLAKLPIEVVLRTLEDFQSVTMVSLDSADFAYGLPSSRQKTSHESYIPVALRSDLDGSPIQTQSKAQELMRDALEMRRTGATTNTIATHFDLEPDKALKLVRYLDQKLHA